MTDIVERLRALQQLAEADKPFGYVKDIFRCSADEIERLRGDVEYWKHNTDLLPLRAEIERLQAVIASHHEFFEGAKANLNDARNLIATLRAELREAGLLR